MRLNSLATAISTGLGFIWTASAVAAQTISQELEVVGAPTPRGTGFQPSATELARDVVWLDNMLLIIITAISLFVTGLLAWVVIRYNQKRNPTPATFTHNSPLEVAWTIGPVVILVFIGAFSLPVLFKQQEIPEADITIDVTNSYPPLGTAESAEVTRFVRSLSVDAAPIKVAFGTEGGLFSSILGVPTVVCGPGSMDQGHKPDEFISVSQLDACDAMLNALLGRLHQGV